MHCPSGDKVIIAGGMDYTDHAKVYITLDKLHFRHPNLVLLHGGALKGVDHIAAQWANSRDIAQIILKPDWNKHGKKRAGFVRNDQMIAQEPIGAIIFPGSGVTENLADKAQAHRASSSNDVPKAHQALLVFGLVGLFDRRTECLNLEPIA